jgi:hypothetical protein
MLAGGYQFHVQYAQTGALGASATIFLALDKVAEATECRNVLDDGISITEQRRGVSDATKDLLLISSSDHAVSEKPSVSHCSIPKAKTEVIRTLPERVPVARNAMRGP